MKLKNKINAPQLEKVSTFKRGIAAILDMYIASVLANIPILFIYSIETGETKMTKPIYALSSKSGILACILGILMVWIYYLILPVYKFNGQTLMKKLLGFRIVKMNGSNVDLKTMIRREVLGSMIVEGGFMISGDYLRQLILIISGSKMVYKGLIYTSFSVTILSIILMIFFKENRTIHDYIAGTRVLSLNK